MSTGKTGKALLELTLSFPDRLLVTFGFAYRIDQTHFSYLSFYITWRDISINERKFNDILQESLSLQKRYDAHPFSIHLNGYYPYVLN